MRRENFNETMEEPMAKYLKQEIARIYKYVIQEPLHEHRDEMSQRFQNRIDYVNIAAYGIGKVTMDENGEPQGCETSDSDEEDEFGNFNN